MPDEISPAESLAQKNHQDTEFLSVPESLEQPELGHSIDLFREKLTTRLLWVFGGTIGAEVFLAGITAFTGHDASTVRDIFHDVIPAETGLLGLAIGYYFGEKAQR